MRILMLGWELPPHNSGGLGVACYQLCKALAGRDADIDFILPFELDAKPSFMTVKAAIKQSPETFHSSPSAYQSKFLSGQSSDLTLKQLEYKSGVMKLVEDQEYDVIHAHDWLTFRAALAVKSQTGWPLVVHFHSVESDRAGGHHGNPLVREIEALALNLADKVIAVSDQTKKALVRDYGVPAEIIEVVHNSLDQSELEALDSENIYRYLDNLKANNWQVVTSIGRLTIQKGLSNLLRAMQSVIEFVPKTILLIVGSGELYEELVELTAELGISQHVLFAGFQRGKAWRDAFAIADLFVLPSVSEPFGLTPLEALYYGTPSLISKQSGVGEVLSNCLKVDYWDEREMTNQIVNALREPALRQEMAANGTHELSNVSWYKSADKVLDIYKQHASSYV